MGTLEETRGRSAQRNEIELAVTGEIEKLLTACADCC